MLYSFLGRIVWKFAKRRLKSRSPGGRSVAAVAVGAVAAAGALLARRVRSSGSR